MINHYEFDVPSIKEAICLTGALKNTKILPNGFSYKFKSNDKLIEKLNRYLGTHAQKYSPAPAYPTTEEEFLRYDIIKSKVFVRELKEIHGVIMEERVISLSYCEMAPVYLLVNFKVSSSSGLFYPYVKNTRKFDYTCIVESETLAEEEKLKQVCIGMNLEYKPLVITDEDSLLEAIEFICSGTCEAYFGYSNSVLMYVLGSYKDQNIDITDLPCIFINRNDPRNEERDSYVFSLVSPYDILAGDIDLQNQGHAAAVKKKYKYDYHAYLKDELKKREEQNEGKDQELQG